ncbi:hypothetical protein C7T94_14220 [Pedobacter yulinensis]|uniref:Uncharacterized protein n=1 Tax=Pedobacter yulinensis TaxID=2126353 RepID=A0A2T3HMR1_9SPHI|nr:hypothetical protein C7T94_14220 [Pedobacter yulinensis]
MTLADGYLLASKIVIHSKQGDQLFLPADIEVDENGKLRFDAVQDAVRHRTKEVATITLSGLDEHQVLPTVGAIYWDGKAKRSIIFKKSAGAQ